MEDAPTPKAFISYSRTNADHIRWIVDLAQELVENGVEVILDEWNLQEGQDLYAFMEQAVTDPEMDKVIIVSDEEYARKADEREGGVGTETQIISQDLYDEEVDPDDPQRKFVAVVAERDEDGNAFLPTYMGSRLYIDMSTQELRRDNFEQLLRWLYDEPISEEPELGEPPAYILQDEGPELGTNSRARRAKKLLRDGDTASLGALREYFETFAENLERFEIESDNHRLPPEDVLESIERFRPFRDEAVEVFATLADYWPGDEAGQILHRFFEQLLPYRFTEGPRRPRGTSVDNFAFFVRELFLCATAVLLDRQRFESVELLMTRRYHVEDDGAGQVEPQHFTVFRPYIESLEKHLDHNRINKVSDLIAKRAGQEGPENRDLMQADLVLYLRAEMERMHSDGSRQISWYPDTLLRARDRVRPFRLFARAANGTVEPLDTLFPIFGWDEFAQAVTAIGNGRGFVKFDRWPLEVPRLVGIDQ